MYDRLSIQDFGHQLIESKDLDPVYVALAAQQWPVEAKHRWLIAYWCFYHCGFASWLAEREGIEFWDTMMIAARNEEEAPPGGRWPRGRERRHFRGKHAMRAVTDLRNRFGENPEGMVDEIAEAAPAFKDVNRVSQSYTGFGPWIAFKIGDMLDRCLGIPVDFTEAEVFMFKDPVQAALMLWRQQLKLPKGAKPKDQGLVIREVVRVLTAEFERHPAPPLDDRPCGLQEVETVLCKWKSHMNGHYPLNNDIHEIRHGLEEWLGCGALVGDFLEEMP